MRMQSLERLSCTAVLLASVTYAGLSAASSKPEPLIGAWRSKMQFKDGLLAEVKDLELSYVFNLGGTMVESSNYDEA